MNAENRTWQLLDATGQPYASGTPGTLGGHRRLRIYGRLDCPSALRHIANGNYVEQRVFFADEATAIAAGYHPCGVCLRERHVEWKSDPDRFAERIVGLNMTESAPKPERKSWTADENRAVVDAYFSMLDDELSERDYNKTAVRRHLMAGELSGRSKGSIEFKMQNVSAVLDDYSLPWIEGYKPRRNYQADLAGEVLDTAKARGLEPSAQKRTSTS